MDIQCEVRKLVFKSKHKFYEHLTTHDISRLDYWRKYIVHDDTAGNCLVCGKLLNLNRFNLFRGFNVKVHSGKCNACTKETFLLKYFVETYGDDGSEMYTELNKKKANTLDNFIKRYGEDGLMLYENYLDRIQHGCYCSKAATEFFTELSKTYVTVGNLYFGEKEFGLMYKDTDGKAEYFKYDFVDTQKKKIIEYNGDYWHAKSENDPEWLPEKHRGITAAESFKHDGKKKLCALQNGYKIFIFGNTK